MSLYRQTIEAKSISEKRQTKIQTKNWKRNDNSSSAKDVLQS